MNLLLAGARVLIFAEPTSVLAPGEQATASAISADLDVHVVLDNYGTHKTAPTRRP